MSAKAPAKVTPIGVRQEAQYSLGRVKGGKALHATLTTSTGHVSLCTRQPVKVDPKIRHREDIGCNACRSSLNRTLEATG